ncbi:MAG: hypothetical protein LBD97_10705 [Bifidobacteriaceae bacterium]|jgi:hypothetical protein|nr:hypothetical protein [Bifidobacteriaceae bacterium]
MQRKALALGAALLLLAGCAGGGSGDEATSGAVTSGADQPAVGDDETGTATSDQPDNWVDANCPMGEYDSADTSAKVAAAIARERCVAGDWGASLLAGDTGLNLAGWSMTDTLALSADFVLATTTSELLADLFTDKAGQTPLRVQLQIRQSTGWDGTGADPRETRREVTVSNVRVGAWFGEGDHTLVPVEDAALADPDPPSLLWQDEADSWNGPYFASDDVASNSADTPQGAYSLAEFGKLPEVSEYYFDRSALGRPWVFGGAQALDPYDPDRYWLDDQDRVVTFLLPPDISDWTLLVFDISADGSEPREVATWLSAASGGRYTL